MRRRNRGRQVWLGAALMVAVFALALGGESLAQQAMGIADREVINAGLGPPPPQVGRSTPAMAWRSFLSLGRAGEFATAAHLLDLSEVPVAQERAVGAELADKLFQVVRALGLGPEEVTNDTSAGPTEAGMPLNVVVVDRFLRKGIAGEIWLRRTKNERTGEVAWLFTRQTVSGIRFWYSVLVGGEKPHDETSFNAGLGPPPPSVQRANPRQSVAGFLAAVDRGDFRLAANYLDLGDVAPAQQPVVGPRLARRLMLIFFSHDPIDPSTVSNDPLGAPEADVPDNEERITTITVGHEKIDILLERHWDAQLGQVWTFSRGTVSEVDHAYRALGFGWLADRLPHFFFSVRFMQLQLWQWTALVLIIGLGFGAARVIGHWLVLALRAVARRTDVTWDDVIVGAFDGPIGFILWALGVALLSPLVGLNESARRITQIGWNLLALVGLGWLLQRLLDVLVGHLRTIGGANSVAMTFAPIMRRIGNVTVVVLIVLAALDVVGVKVVALLAGLGIGGVAIAFAAQKTIENLFGALAIAGDRPFSVGDYVTIGEVSGTVEDIGLRSTRIRTLERTLVTIANGNVVAGLITNYGARDRIFFNPTIGVLYGTSAAQLIYITDEIRKLLLSHPKVWQDMHRCRFKAFGASSLDIEVFAWIDTTDYNEYTAVAEELNFRIAEIVEAAGTGFAFPSRTVYVAQDTGIDPEKARSAEAEVARRRAAGDLAVPEPSPELAARLRRRPAG
ncbi:MAG: mechanosensitive ion channel family protein [Acidobacteriota bacterium]